VAVVFEHSARASIRFELKTKSKMQSGSLLASSGSVADFDRPPIGIEHWILDSRGQGSTIEYCRWQPRLTCLKSKKGHRRA